jgi:nucleoside-diphosphate-sugar epimerase
LNAALKAGHDLLCLRRSTRSCPVIPLPSEPEWINQELHYLTPDDLSGCSVVVHLASAGVSPQQVPWHELVHVNVMGAAHLIAAADQAGVKRMVVSGTCHEYGALANRKEAFSADAPLEPMTLYGASKAASFHLLSAYARSTAIELYYGRIFNVYGEGQYEKNFWPSLHSAAREGADFPMTSGEQVRDFIPVERVAEKLLDACTRPMGENSHILVENIGSGQPKTLLCFAEQEWSRLGAVGKLLPGSFPTSDMCFLPASTPANRFTPQTIRPLP